MESFSNGSPSIGLAVVRVPRTLVGRPGRV